MNKTRKTLQQRISHRLVCLITILTPLLWGGVGGGLLSACSESDDEAGEFDNWQQRNEAYFATLSDSLRANPGAWRKLKCYALDESTEGKTTDYIYVKVVKQGDGTESPMFTDSVRVSYQGRLIPSVTYPAGFVFDGTVYGNYDDRTNATTRQKLSAMIDGYATALLHMHRGDHWRVYIPADLAYGKAGSGTTIPGYSVVIFDLTLIDFSSAGQTMPVWSARRHNL